jgi:hypothetical protein
MLLAPLLVACAGETLAEPVGTVTPTSTVRPAIATATPTTVRSTPVPTLTAAPTVAPTVRPAAPTPTPPPRAPAPPVSPPPPPPANCDPSYPDVCIPRGAADYDCAGGTGNGPNYIRGPLRVLPPDPHDLDRDGNGIGCQ